jgi:outer membrane protein TolC
MRGLLVLLISLPSWVWAEMPALVEYQDGKSGTVPFEAPRPSQAEGALLSLDEALRLALKNNRGVVNAALGVKKASEGVGALKSERLPQLKVGVFEAYNLTDQAFTLSRGELSTTPIPIPSEDTRIATVKDFSTLITASVALPISQQYKIGLGIEQRELFEAVANQQFRLQRQGIAKNVRDLYYSILRTQASLAATKSSVEYLGALSANVDKNVELKRVLASDGLQAQTQLARARQRARVEEDSIDSQHEQMNLLLGRPISTPFRLSLIPDPVDFNIDPARAESVALAQRPNVQVAKLKEQSTELDIRIKKWEYIPELSMELRYSTQFGSEFIPKDLASVGLFASWDIWDWGKRSHEISAKKVELRQAQNQIREAEARVRVDVNEKIRSLGQAEDRVPVSRMAAAAADEKLRVAQNQYAEQAILIEDLLRASADVAQARRGVEDAKLAVWMSWTDLMKAMGEE